MIAVFSYLIAIAIDCFRLPKKVFKQKNFQAIAAIFAQDNAAYPSDFDFQPKPIEAFFDVFLLKVLAYLSSKGWDFAAAIIALWWAVPRLQSLRQK